MPYAKCCTRDLYGYSQYPSVIICATLSCSLRLWALEPVCLELVFSYFVCKFKFSFRAGWQHLQPGVGTALSGLQLPAPVFLHQVVRLPFRMRRRDGLSFAGQPVHTSNHVFHTSPTSLRILWNIRRSGKEAPLIILTRPSSSSRVIPIRQYLPKLSLSTYISRNV